MSYLNVFIYYATLSVFLFLFLQSSYLFVFALAGRLISLKNFKHTTRLGSFVIYLYACRDEEVAEAAKAVLSLSYPADRKHLVVIADSLRPETLLALRELPVQIIEISGNKISKAKALQTALQQTEGQFDYALMLDADQACTRGFLYRMNDVLQSGYLVAQGQHVVKNTNTTFALINAISEGIDTHIFCKSHRLLGLSAAITGSGVAIHFSLFAEIIPCLTAGNFDREIELHLLRKRIHFGYAQKALIYEQDRNRQSPSEQQFYKWIFAQSYTIKSYMSDGFLQLCKGNIDFLDKVFQNLMLPRILMLGITPLAVLLSLLPGPALSTDYWIFLWIITYAAMLISVPAKYVTNQFLKAIFLLPSLFLRIASLVFKVRNGNTRTRFIAI